MFLSICVILKRVVEAQEINKKDFLKTVIEQTRPLNDKETQIVESGKCSEGCLWGRMCYYKSERR